MANIIKFTDNVSLGAPVIGDDVREFYSKQENLKAAPLRIRLAATHAGKRINNRFYLPDRMRAGTSSFLARYPKPIQTHHDSHKDPIGRVVAANYVDLTSVVRNAQSLSRLGDSAEKLSLLDSFVLGKMNKKESIDFACNYLLQDNSLENDPSYEGLGYVELTADITDPDAIVKVLDRRYLTGSVGASTDSATCNVCKVDWASEGPCEHAPGKTYKNVKCALITGNLSYSEWSFVNRPADELSGVIEVNIGGMRDFVSIENKEELSVYNQTGAIYEVAFIRDEQTQEDSPMSLKELLVAFFGDSLEGIVGDDQWGESYAEMVHDYLQTEGLSDEQKQEMQDAKLTAAARQKLASSVFCGPNRSYPVQDCSHAKAAMAYAKKNNESASLVACIKRKASRLGCPFSDEQEGQVADEPRYSVEYFDRYEDSEVSDMFNALVQVVDERKLDCGCGVGGIKEPISSVVAKDEKEEEVQIISDEIGLLKKALEDAQKENACLRADIDNLTLAMTDTVAQLRNAHFVRLVDMRRLNGEEPNVDELKTEIQDKTTDEIISLVEDACGKVDIAKITGKIFSCMANDPVGTVDDPTQVVDNTKKTIDSKTKNQVALQYMQIHRTHGETAAKRFLDKCKEDGLIEE